VGPLVYRFIFFVYTCFHFHIIPTIILNPNEAALVRVPTIGTVVRAQVSVFRCPEGTTGYVKAILAESSVPEIVIETYPCGEIAVSARDYPFFFDERTPATGTS